MLVSQGNIMFAVLIMLLLYQSIVSFQYNAINSGITNAPETLLLVREWGSSKTPKGAPKSCREGGGPKKMLERVHKNLNRELELGGKW